MGASPTTTNQVAETFDSIASQISLNLLLPAAEKSLETAAEVAEPWLLTPVIQQLFEGATNEVMGLAAKDLLTALVDNGVKIILTIQTDAEKTVYSAAEGALRSALLGGDPVAIAKAKGDFTNAADSIIHCDGSLNTHAE